MAPVSPSMVHSWPPCRRLWCSHGTRVAVYGALVASVSTSMVHSWPPCRRLWCTHDPRVAVYGALMATVSIQNPSARPHYCASHTWQAPYFIQNPLTTTKLLRSSAQKARHPFHTESPYHSHITAVIRAPGRHPISYRILLARPHYCEHPRQETGIQFHRESH